MHRSLVLKLNKLIYLDAVLAIFELVPRISRSDCSFQFMCRFCRTIFIEFVYTSLLTTMEASITLKLSREGSLIKYVKVYKTVFSKVLQSVHDIFSSIKRLRLATIVKPSNQYAFIMLFISSTYLSVRASGLLLYFYDLPTRLYVW